MSSGPCSCWLLNALSQNDADCLSHTITCQGVAPPVATLLECCIVSCLADNRLYESTVCCNKSYNAVYIQTLTSQWLCLFSLSTAKAKHLRLIGLAGYGLSLHQWHSPSSSFTDSLLPKSRPAASDFPGLAAQTLIQPGKKTCINAMTGNMIPVRCSMSCSVSCSKRCIAIYRLSWTRIYWAQSVHTPPQTGHVLCPARQSTVLWGPHGIVVFMSSTSRSENHYTVRWVQVTWQNLSWANKDQNLSWANRDLTSAGPIGTKTSAGPIGT